MSERRGRDMPEPTEPTAEVYALPSTLRRRALTGFPAAMPGFIGRAQERATLRALLLQPGQRLLTLTGPGGVGKTRLALAGAAMAAEAFAAGAVFVPLAAVKDAELVLPTIARALDVRESPGRPLLATLATALADRPLLLVLDNLEHLPEAAPEIGALLDTCPDLTILATSRAPLRLGVEQRVPVPPLALPAAEGPIAPETLAEVDAIALFVERARRVRPDFTLDAGNAAAVAAICHDLDGLPLAIELAAAWMHVLSPAALLARLERRLPLLTGGSADQPTRLRTMRDAIAWSHDLLTDDEQRLFRRLGVFVGGFTLEAAEWVGGRELEVGGELGDGAANPRPPAPDPVLALLAALVEKSLVQQAAGEGSEPRFSMLETVREFALEQLAASGEQHEVEAKLARFVLGYAELAEHHLFGPDEQSWVSQIDTEIGNVRAALAWSIEHDVETVLRIGAALWVYFAWRLQLSEGRRWIDRALTRGQAVPPLVRSRALTTAAALAILNGDAVVGQQIAGEAISLAQTSGDALAEARARFMLGAALQVQGEVDGAAIEYDESLAVLASASTSTDRNWAAYLRAYRGLVAVVRGETDAALAYYEEALATARSAGSSIITLLILDDFGGLLLELGQTERARSMVTEALTLAARLGEFWPAGHSLFVLAAIDAIDGRLDVAARRIGAADNLLAFAGLALAPPLQQRINRSITQVRAGLGDTAYVAARDEGWTNPPAVIAAALEGRSVDLHAVFGSGVATPTLTDRERDILQLLVAGQSDKQIAETLFISRKTASNHVASILRTLGVKTRAAAAARAARDGLR